jgi:outer membrane protein assembly factor BamB
MRTVLKYTAALIVIAVLSVFYLIRFQGMRLERDGSGIWPMISFHDPDRHLREIEKNRTPVALPDPETTAAIPAEPAATGAPAPARVAEPAAAPAPFWTDFRGPRRDGHYDEMKVLTHWPAAGPQRLWRRPVGGGYASFVIANGRAFTIEQRRNQEVAAAYDLATGREIWSDSWDGYFRESMGGDGPRSTPTWHDGYVYALGAEGELRCLAADSGRRIWSKNILRENGAENLQWGMAASPLIVDEKVIVLPGGPGGKSVVAYDRRTGAVVWSALDDKQAYTSPVLVTLAGERQLLIVSAKRALGLTLDGQRVLWEYPWTTSYDINSAQPVMVGPDRFILSAGYGHGAALVKIEKNGDAFTASTVWENTRMKNKFTSSVLHEGHIYGLDEAILACVNAETGELKWKGGRYGYGQLVLASGHLIIAAEDGDVALVRAVPDRHEEVVRFSAIDGKTWNHPAIAHGILLVRNGTEMSAFRIGVQTATSASR